jgi:predicted ABC-class ATPase
MTKTREDLQRTLGRIDGMGYKAYKQIKGDYHFPDFDLLIDHVQGDPFASPSRLRVKMPQARAGYPAAAHGNRSRRAALCSYLTECFAEESRKRSGRSGTGHSGRIEIDRPGQEILERTSVIVTTDQVEARFRVGLPAAGRRILGREARRILCEDIPAIVDAALRYQNNDQGEIDRYVRCSEDADALRWLIEERDLVAFVADGSILPRASGVDDRLKKSGLVVPFESPPSLRVELKLPNRGTISGLGIPRGVTLVAGGGFHGKSTLLNALTRGVYNHKPGDGREFVVCAETAVKIRAEDGRRVEKADISAFITDLPDGSTTTAFSTENASGSTSQAANIVEALEAGTRLLLIDEDTSATNFMIRDQRMQELVAREKEPITPFIDRVRDLYTACGVSTVLVIGGSGDYFDVADTVMAMEKYQPRDVTPDARAIADRFRSLRARDAVHPFAMPGHRIPLGGSVNPRKGRREVSIKTKGLCTVLYGEETLRLEAVSQLVDPSQTRALADAIHYAGSRYMDGRRTLREVLDLVMADIQERGLDVLSREPMGDYARFRAQELAAALNRLRRFSVRQKAAG